MLEVTARIQIPDDEFHWSFARSGGPGGQNVNKVASKAILHWNVQDTLCLPVDVKQRFLTQQHTRINAEGELVLSSEKYRDQPRNVETVWETARRIRRRCTCRRNAPADEATCGSAAPVGRQAKQSARAESRAGRQTNEVPGPKRANWVARPER